MRQPQLPRTPPRDAKRSLTLVSKFSVSPPRRTFNTLVKSVKDVMAKANLSGNSPKRNSIAIVKDMRRRKPGYIRSSRIAPSRSSITIQRGGDRVMLGGRTRPRPTSDTESLSNPPTLGSLGLLHFFPLLPQPEPSGTESRPLPSIEITSQVILSHSFEEVEEISSNDQSAPLMIARANISPSTATIEDHDTKQSIQILQNSHTFYSIDTESSGSYYDDALTETLDNVFDMSWDSTAALYDNQTMSSGSRNALVFQVQVDSGNPLTHRHGQNLSPIPEADAPQDEVDSFAGMESLDNDNDVDSNQDPSSFSRRSEPISFVSLLNEVHSSRPKTIIEESEGESSPCASSVPSQISPSLAEPPASPLSFLGLLVPATQVAAFPRGMSSEQHEYFGSTQHGPELDHSNVGVEPESNHDFAMNLEHDTEPCITGSSPTLGLDFLSKPLPLVPTTLTDTEIVNHSDTQISHALDALSPSIQISRKIGYPLALGLLVDRELPLLPVDESDHEKRQNHSGAERIVDSHAGNPSRGFRTPPPVPLRSAARPRGPSGNSSNSFPSNLPPSVSSESSPPPRDHTIVTSPAAPKKSLSALFKNFRRPKSAGVAQVGSNVKKPNKIKPVLTPIYIEPSTEASAYSIIQEYDDPFAMSSPLTNRVVQRESSITMRPDSLLSLPYLPAGPMSPKSFHLPTRLTESTLHLHTTLSAAFAHSDSSSFSGATNTNATLVDRSPIYPPSSATTVFSRFAASSGGPGSAVWPVSSPQSPITDGNVTKIDNDLRHRLNFSQANASEPILSLSPPLHDLTSNSVQNMDASSTKRTVSDLGYTQTKEGGDGRWATLLHAASIDFSDPSWAARQPRADVGTADNNAAQLRAIRRKMSILDIM